MKKIISNITIFIVCIYLIIVLVLYLFGVNFYANNNECNVSDEEIIIFFNRNHEELKKIIPLCREHPAIRWLGKKKGQISFYSSPSATQVDYETARLIRRILDPLGVGSVDCSRRFDVPGDTFLGVNFSMYARGFTFAGESKSIRYSLPSTDRAYWEGHKAMLQSGELKPLPEPNWYIYTSQ